MNEAPEPYKPSPYLSDEINRNIEASQIAGGAKLRDLEVGRTLKVQTRNTTYLVKRVSPGPSGFEISGHERFCPTPKPACIHGSTWGGSMLKMEFLGRGMHMEFHLNDDPCQTYTTTPISEIEELPDYDPPPLPEALD